MNYDLIMFDLDGTVIDSGKGIMESAQFALDHFDMPNRPEDELRLFVGPSLMDSFMNRYGFSEEKAREAVNYYRSVYSTENLFHLTVYPDIKEVVLALKEKGKTTVLVTSKPAEFASRILEKYGLSDCFSFIKSPSLTDPSSDKTKLINDAINEAQIPKDKAIMIGDRHFDILGAKNAGVDSIGVLYGYGSKEELESNGTTYLAETAKDILNLLP